MITEKNSQDIFNADKTGLFYRCTQDKTLTFEGEQCSGGKQSKRQITVRRSYLSKDGFEKLQLLIIGKSANPRCFKNVKLNVKYFENKTKR